MMNKILRIYLFMLNQVQIICSHEYSIRRVLGVHSNDDTILTVSSDERLNPSSPPVYAKESLIAEDMPVEMPSFFGEYYYSYCNSEGPQRGFDGCEFTNEIYISLGNDDALLEESSNRESLATTLKKWINEKRECEEVDEVYYGFEIEDDETTMRGGKTKGRRGKGKGRCRGYDCPKDIKFSYPKILNKVVCDNTTLLEEIKNSGNPDFADLTEVEFVAENSTIDLLDVLDDEDETEQYNATKAVYTLLGMSNFNEEEHECAWEGINCNIDKEIISIIIQGTQLARDTRVLATELGLLTELGHLDLRGLRLYGKIPTEMGLLRNLTFTDMSDNLLTGCIPTELGQIQNIEYLRLHSNSLSGCIPSELGLLTNVEDLTLSNNFLKGRIPPELGNLENISFLMMHGNFRLHGLIPGGLCNDEVILCTNPNLALLLFRVICPQSIRFTCPSYWLSF